MIVFQPPKAGIPGNTMIDVTVDYFTSLLSKLLLGNGVHANTRGFHGLQTIALHLHQMQGYTVDNETQCYIQIRGSF